MEERYPHYKKCVQYYTELDNDVCAAVQ